MSKKRARESSGPDVALVEVYEDLAHEDENVRLKAAHSLLTKHLPAADSDRARVIFTRLFRGVCSSRKAARLGFSIALTEALVQLKQKLGQGLDDLLSPSQVIDILEKQTVSEGSINGQDERDHYFGRLFACEAVMKSELLFDKASIDQWERLLDLVCGVAAKKPWLRQECGWILYNCFNESSHGAHDQELAIKILQKLDQHKMIRTPEGLAIWIKLRHWIPKAKMPKHVWKHNDPFSANHIQTLADVLKNAKPSSQTNAEFEVQGSATWTASLHFVWDIVLSELFSGSVQEDPKEKQKYFRQFWKLAVDDALFAPSTSAERKHWGLQVMQKALNLAPSNLIQVVFSPNATSCLMQSLKAGDRYLQRSAQKTIQTIQKCVTRKPMDVSEYVLGLLIGANVIDFDAFTKTKTAENLIGACTPEAALNLFHGLHESLKSSFAADLEGAEKRRILVLNLESKVVIQQVNQALKKGVYNKQDAVYSILQSWIELAFGQPDIDDSTKKLFYGKIQFGFEHALKLGGEGRALVLDGLKMVHKYRDEDHLEAEADVKSLVRAGWKRFKALHKLAEKSKYLSLSTDGLPLSKRPETSKASAAEITGGIALLYGMTLLEISIGDIEAIQILKDMLDSEASGGSKSQSSAHGYSSGADELVEIMLSFASRQSKFARRLSLVVFEALASQITRNGLHSLLAILETPESATGQQELFDAGGDEDAAGDENDEDDDGSSEIEDSDVEMVGSDVEVLDALGSDDASISTSASDSEDASDTEDSSSSDSNIDATETQNADLIALEASLASALGTRKITQDDMDMASASDSDSDADMTDSEMMALDEKLAEVFKHRVQGSKGTKKKEQKNAKENIVNFKNRVLDLTDVYIKQQHLKSHSLDLILPLLQLTRDTNTKQLAGRAIALLQMYCKRCSGMQNVPVLPHHEPLTNGTSSTKDKKKSKTDRHPSIDLSDSNDTSNDDFASHTTATALSILNQIHVEASRPGTSNAHRSACSQTSILLVKTLLKAGVNIETLVAVYADTRTRMLVDETCRVHEGFFVDWGNWCVSVRGKARSYADK